MQIKLFTIKVIIASSAFNLKKNNEQQEYVPLLHAAGCSKKGCLTEILRLS